MYTYTILYPIVCQFQKYFSGWHSQYSCGSCELKPVSHYGHWRHTILLGNKLYPILCVCVWGVGGGTNDTTKQVPVIQTLNSAVHQALVVQRFDSIIPLDKSLSSLLISIRETNCIIHRREIYRVDSIIHRLSILDAYSKVRYYPLARWEVFPVLGVTNPGRLGVGGVTPSLNLRLWFDNYCFQRKWSTISSDLRIFNCLIF